MVAANMPRLDPDRAPEPRQERSLMPAAVAAGRGEASVGMHRSATCGANIAAKHFFPIAGMADSPPSDTVGIAVPAGRVMAASELDLDKLKELVLLLARHPSVRDLGVTKLNKLVYYVDAEALRKTGESITGSEYIKHEHGPVPSRIERALKQLRRADAARIGAEEYFDYELKRVEALRDADRARFTVDELAIVDRIAAKLGQKTADELSTLSHQEPAWREAEYLEKMDPDLIPYGTKEDPDDL